MERRGPVPSLVALLDLAAGIAVCLLIGWLAVSGWRFYALHLLPQARAIPTATATPVVDPEALRQEARRLRQVLDHVGAGITFRAANQRERAIQEFQGALALDPANADARQHLVEMGLPLPALAPTPTPPPPALATATLRR